MEVNITELHQEARLLNVDARMEIHLKNQGVHTCIV